MKFEKIVDLIKTAGFTFINEGRGIGAFEGYQAFHYSKGLARNTQCIQLAQLDIQKDIVGVVFSNNIPEKLRDEVYVIINEPTSKDEIALTM